MFLDYNVIYSKPTLYTHNEKSAFKMHLSRYKNFLTESGNETKKSTLKVYNTLLNPKTP